VNQVQAQAHSGAGQQHLLLAVRMSLSAWRERAWSWCAVHAATRQGVGELCPWWRRVIVVHQGLGTSTVTPLWRQPRPFKPVEIHLREMVNLDVELRSTVDMARPGPPPGVNNS